MIEKKTDDPVTATVPAKATPLVPGEPVKIPAALGATFAERKKAREAAEKAIQGGENKTIKAAEGK